MSETANAIHRLTERAHIDTTGANFASDQPRPDRAEVTIGPGASYPTDPVYDFEHLGLRIAESLVLAAEQQVAEANSLLEQTRALAESIRSQVKIQTEALASLNGRLKTFGVQMLEAHRKFNGHG